MRTFVILLGLNDKETKLQKYDSVEAYKIVNNLVCARIGYGTVSSAYGVYTHGDGTPVIEQSLRIEVAGSDRPKILGLVETLKEAFNQESVMLTEQDSAVSFV